MATLDFTPTLDQLVIWAQESQIIVDFFVQQKGKKQIILHQSASLLYVPILIESELDFDVILDGENATLTYSGIALSTEIPSASQTVAHLQSDKTHADIQLLWLPGRASCRLTGELDIAKDISWVTAYLHQHQLIREDSPIQTLAFPKLHVNSYQVKAWHWASIHQLDPKYLFYLMAKWLDLKRAQHLVIHGHIEHMLDRAHLDDGQKTLVLEKLLPYIDL